MNNRVLFLDRDGVINKRLEGYVTTIEEFEFLPGVLEAIPVLNQMFDRVFIVTNQQGIAKGLMTEDDLEIVHEHMLKGIRDKKGWIDEVYYCLHAEGGGCNCRKPEIGMYNQALQDFPDIEGAVLYMVGDSPSDMQFANRIGAIGAVCSLTRLVEEIKW